MVRQGIEANQALRSRFSSAMSTTLEDAEIANKDINSSVDREYLILHALLHILELCLLTYSMDIN